MPRVVKGSGPRKATTTEVEEFPGMAEAMAEDLDPDGLLTGQREDASLDEGRVREEFNNHVKDLVALFFEKKVEGLEQRITDLETVVGSFTGAAAAAAPVPGEVGAPQYDVPEYKPTHQDSGSVPWY